MIVIAFVGGRALRSPLVQRCAGKAAAHGHQVSVGCCVGADAAALEGAASHNPDSVRVFAAFGPDGAGSCSLSNTKRVIEFAEHGGLVSWWAGGHKFVPLKARLALRANACVESADLVVAAFQDGPSVGTLRAVYHALDIGLPVAVLPVGTPPPINSRPVQNFDTWSIPFPEGTKTYHSQQENLI